MPSLNSSHIAWINRPYFDLGSLNDGPVHIYGVEFNYQNLISNTNTLYSIQANVSSNFRQSLVQETGMSKYQIDHPLQLPYELRTERWNKLCEYLTHYQDLQPLTKLLLMRLLRSLGFHRVILEYVPEMSSAEIATSSILADLAFCRAISNLILNINHGTLNNLDELEIIANNAPYGTLARMSAILQIVVQYAKTFKDLESAEFWRTIADQEIHQMKSSLDDFTYGRMLSIYYRAVVFVPMLHGNKDKVVQEMDLCQSYAESLTCENEVQQIVANENRFIIQQSRVKEALWLHDLDLAEARARQLAEMDPLDSIYHFELGEVLIKQGKIKEAVKAYAVATKLGPPQTVIAWFRMGQCYEVLDELEKASNCYLTCLHFDPEAISAVEQLANLAPSLANSALIKWSKLRLIELQEQIQITPTKAHHTNQSEVASKVKNTPVAMFIGLTH